MPAKIVNKITKENNIPQYLHVHFFLYSWFLLFTFSIFFFQKNVPEKQPFKRLNLVQINYFLKKPRNVFVAKYPYHKLVNVVLQKSLLNYNKAYKEMAGPILRYYFWAAQLLSKNQFEFLPNFEGNSRHEVIQFGKAIAKQVKILNTF